MCVGYGKYGVNAYNIPAVEEVLTRNAKNGFLNIVAVHAGLEHVNFPSLEHIRTARQLSEITPYVYYGHHPHVIQGVEKYNGSLIAHSLGNFCFDDIYNGPSSKPFVSMTDNNRTGMILELVIENSKVIDYKEQLIYINPDRGIELTEKGALIKQYNEAVINCEDNACSYSSKRNELLNKRLKERKTIRDLSWYLKRLRPRYAQLLLNAKRNARRYQENVLQYIK